MSRKIKILIILINLVLILFLISNTVFATLVDKFDKSIDTTKTGDIKYVSGKILGIIRVIGTIIVVGVLMVLGIKYMLGSSAERAGYKKTMIPYLIGAVLIFSTIGIVDMIYKTIHDIDEFKCNNCKGIFRNIYKVTAFRKDNKIVNCSNYFLCDDCFLDVSYGRIRLDEGRVAAAKYIYKDDFDESF